MKTFHSTSFIRTAAIALLFTFFGFAQQAQAQLVITNTTNCWILVGEQEGSNCIRCNTPAGTWIAPNTPFTIFPVSCFSSSPNGDWIGVKYAAASFPSVFLLGPGSFTYNTLYPGGQCGFSQNNSSCGFPIVPTWTTTNSVVF